MSKCLRAVVCGCVLALAAASVQAADVSRLEWGGYTVDNDSSNGLLDWKTVASDDGRNISMTFDSLEAKADGSTTEARASFSGHYDINQPGYEVFSNLHIELRGHVIKSSTSVARIILTIGAASQTIEWPAGTAASEHFTREIDIPVQAGIRLPDPFQISAHLYARKEAQPDAAYVSLESLKVTAEHPKVAAR